MKPIFFLILQLCFILDAALSKIVSIDTRTWDQVMNETRFGSRSIFPIGIQFPSFPNLLHSFPLANVSEKCEKSLNDFITSLSNWETWSVRMADASAKLPGGFLDGTVMDFGSFDECLRIRVTNSSKDGNRFQGRYCMVGYQSPLLSRFFEKNLTQGEYAAAYGHPPEWIMDFIERSGPYLRHMSLWLGMCVPSPCSGDEVKQILEEATKPFGLNVSVAGCQVDEPKYWSASAIVAACALCTVVGVCIIGTTLDVLMRTKSENFKFLEPNDLFFRILKPFSVYLNMENLFTPSKGANSLGCFIGLRIYSILWIIWGHTYSSFDAWKYQKFGGSLERSIQFHNGLLTAPIDSSSLAVATFFFISGYLLMFSEYTRLVKNKGNLNIFMFIFRKFWRLTPCLGLLVVCFMAMQVMGSGPLWNSTIDPVLRNCEQRWWSNFLYINNWWDASQMCLHHTWYLSVLMQLHILGIILVFLFYRWPVVGIVFGCIIAIGCCLTDALIEIWNDYPLPARMTLKDLDLFRKFSDEVYFKTHHSANTYLIGMVVAYIVMKYKENKLSRIHQVLGWTLSFFGSFTSVCGVYGPDVMTYKAFYLPYHRIAWTLSVAWLSYTCITGYGGIVNRFLSFRPLGPIGQLTFLAYLAHPLAMYYRTATERERHYYRHADIMYDTIVNSVIGFLLAFVGHVSVEAPFVTLDGIFFRDKSARKSLDNPGKNETHPETGTVPLESLVYIAHGPCLNSTIIA